MSIHPSDPRHRRLPFARPFARLFVRSLVRLLSVCWLVRISVRLLVCLCVFVQYKVAGGLVLGIAVPWMCSYAVANDAGSRRLVEMVSPSYGEQGGQNGQ